MQGHEPLPAEFGIADPQSVRGDCPEFQAGGFRTPQAGRREQPDDVMEVEWL